VRDKIRQSTDLVSIDGPDFANKAEYAAHGIPAERSIGFNDTPSAARMSTARKN